MTRPVPTSWARLPAAHLAFIAQVWAERDPAYAAAAEGEALLAALRADTSRHEDEWRLAIPDWLLPIPDLDLTTAAAMPVLAAWAAEPPAHACADETADGWRQVLLLTFDDGAWLTAAATGCDCYDWLDHVQGDAAQADRVAVTVTAAPDWRSVVAAGLTPEDRERLHLSLPHEAWTLDDLVAA